MTEAGQAPIPGGDFRLFITKLSIQGMISLGILENPLTKQSTPNLDHARSLIEDLGMLKEKTAGNLNPDEEAHLNKVLGDLQWQFVEKTKGEDGGGTEN